MTLQDSLAVRCFINHAPPKIMAKQWLQLYQRGPIWVMPSVMSSTITNAFLAWSSAPGSTQRSIYIFSAALIWTILPITFLYFEPGINGACKWKVESLLADEGVRLPPFNGVPSSVRHSATPSTKQWAEKTGVKELVVGWEKRNLGRCVVSILAAAVSGYATLSY